MIVDDDKDILDLLSDYLKCHHYEVTCLLSGKTLNRILADKMVDLIILDVMMPGVDGLTLCREIRTQYNVPILILSAAESEGDRVLGLELGADDYMVKPFSSRELLARVKALLRRSSGQLAENTMRLNRLSKIYFGNLVLDRENHTIVGHDGIALSLSQREYELLITFLEHAKRILSRDQLMELLYDKEGEPFDRTIDVLVARLRKKIELDSKSPKLLVTVRGGGYKLACHVEWENDVI